VPDPESPTVPLAPSTITDPSSVAPSLTRFLGTGALSASGERPVGDEALARQASMILSAMDVAGEGRSTPKLLAGERRAVEHVRREFRVPASVRLFADPAHAEPWPIFLRDVEPRAAGFIAPDRLPLGYGGRLTFTPPGEKSLSIDVTLVRCRVCYAGWYEGAFYFHQVQPSFGEDVAGD
jgi:hypothetical protein